MKLEAMGASRFALWTVFDLGFSLVCFLQTSRLFQAYSPDTPNYNR